MLSRDKFAMVVAEILGTGVLTGVVLTVSRSPIGLPYFVALAAGLTLAILVLVIGPTSGAHVNPAVTLSLWTLRKINTIKAIVYIVAQFMGAALAWKLYTYLSPIPVKNIAGPTFDWKVLVAEAVGTFIFTFGIAAAVYQGYEGGKRAATIGGALLMGIFIASAGSNGMLNPAVALGAQSWSKAYVFGPLIGGVVGMNLYSLLFANKMVATVGTKSASSSATTTSKTKKKAPAKKRK
jgi:glycerol uptake facilitator-like aquaporin